MEELAGSGESAALERLSSSKVVIQDRGGHKVLISALSPMLVLDLEGGRSQNETTVDLYQDNGSSAQRFDFLK